MTIQLNTPTLACASCVNTVTAAIKNVDANAEVQANTKTKLIVVETQASELAIREALINAGYPAS
ncbi:heavy-metal-associated domain-containing protein [Pseudanabaena sp. ABRG5-3]|uniref:heavy-metal-associated domain-containing protein n=1 Tax=Pseudanabaena sp. ABRG5-3 TaxID=685565 RepID=UPI000DC705DC|nr:heavy-metal-associated domain-containing protein [Pseudanabaena sp. ABRG5-3]BBC25018.1 heavy metal transport/detoxification protein [Pseudanabaena sp. ABRG5-3]